LVHKYFGMNNRIALVLKAKNISPSTLADDLGVQRSGISHILNGRNKPSLEFIQKLIKLYPDISIQWILFGEGQMMNPYPGRTPEVAESNTSIFPDEKPKPRIMELFSTLDEQEQIEPTAEEGKVLKNEGQIPLKQTDTELLENDISEAGKIKEEEFIETAINETVISPQGYKKSEPKKPEVHSAIKEIKKPEQPLKAVRKISKILVFYNDRTFVEYSPGEEEI